MVEPDKKDLHNTTDLEDTVRNLREENAKLLQLLRSQGLIVDNPANQNGKANESIPSNNHQDSSNIMFDHSDLTLTTNSINTTNQTTHQHVNNHGPTNQQNYSGQTIHGNQSNITPNFNTVIQTTTQPFVQNNSNTLVQNNTNLIQPINLVNFNNVSLDSLQTLFGSQNNLMYLSQTSSASSTTTTTTTSTTTAVNSTSTNVNLNETATSNTQSILPSPSSEQQQQHISIRLKPSLIHQNQELVPVIPKIKSEHYESITRQMSSSNNDTTNLLDNDPNHKFPRPIRPKPSSRANSSKAYNQAISHEPKSSSTNNSIPTSSLANNRSPRISLFSSPISSPPVMPTSYLSQSSSIDHSIDHPPPLYHSRSLDSSVPALNNLLSSPINSPSLSNLPAGPNKKSDKNRVRNRKKAATSSVIAPSNTQTLVPIAPNLGRPLAPAPANVQRLVTSNNVITKRSTTNKKQTKRTSKTLTQYHSESILQQNASSPSNAFAESISGLLENFDQELLASNFLSETATTATTTTTRNLLYDENNSIPSSNTNAVRTLDNINVRHLVNGAVHRQELYHTTTASMPTLDEFNDRLNHETILNTQPTNDFNIEAEHITSFMSEEDMRLVEMNFDENTFLRQFDLEDAGIRLSVNSDENLFANILKNNNDLIQTQQQQPIGQLSISNPNQTSSSVPPASLPSVYPGSSLINNNVFTTVVPLGSRQGTSQTTTFITKNNAIGLLPQEGVRLTARHIEPSQVATYESAKYQDILDDLVMVTDQDALVHAQAAVVDEASVVSTDFSFALLEATNEIMKDTNIEIVDGTSSAFTGLQYFYPIEQDQELLHKQLDECQEKQHEILHDQQPIVILDKLQSEIIASTTLTNPLPNELIMNTTITDLSSILQFESALSPAQHDTSAVDLETPIRPTKTLSHVSPSKSLIHDDHHPIDYDSLLPPIDNHSTTPYSPISDTLALSSNSLRQQSQSIESPKTDPMSLKPCILFETISSPSNPSSPLKSSQSEMIIDSGRLDEVPIETTTFLNNEDAIEELLRDTTTTTIDPYEIIEKQGKTVLNNHVILDDVDQLMDQIEPSSKIAKNGQLLEQTFSRYRQKYHSHLQREQHVSPKKPLEQSLPVPSVKLKLHAIYPEKSLKKEKRRKSSLPSSSPPPPLLPPQSPPKQTDNQLTERPPLKITIRTKLPPPPPSSSNSSEDKTQNKKIRKSKKKKSHHHHHHHHQQQQQQQQQKKKVIADQLETEYAGLTRFERPLAQLYHQQSPPTPDETLPKQEILSSPSTQSESQPSTTLHSGFMIGEQTPPSSITSTEHKLSPPPLLLSQSRNEKLKINYSHLFDYENNNHEHQNNNNTYITPPPEIDLNLQQSQKNSVYENYCQFPTSPNKKKHHHRKSSVTSSTSSKSLTNTDYAIDTQALEPVSPTPLAAPKQKYSQNSSTTSSATSNSNALSPTYFEQQQRQTKDYYSKKASSANRSSKAASSQIYQQSRSLSNQNYRTTQEPPVLPPVPPMHLDPYAQTYHHFAPRATSAPAPFFNFPFPHPFLNPHAAPASSHFHHHPMKYHHQHHHHPHASHAYPTHQQQYPYHPNFQRHQQQQYNGSNYMSSRDHHSFDR